MGKLNIMGVKEIAERINRDREFVYVLHQRGKLPPHDDEIGGRKVWSTSTIERWVKAEHAAGRI